MWEPISREKFLKHMEDEIDDLDEDEAALFNKYRIPIETARIKRSEHLPDDPVFVVARIGEEVVYFDDVEWGFVISPIADGVVTDVTGTDLRLWNLMRCLINDGTS